MPLVPGHQVVSACSIGAFQKLVIFRVDSDLQVAGGVGVVGTAADELEHLLLKSSANMKPGAGENLPIFGHNRFADT